MIHRIPFALALLSLIGGILISIFFGINEDYFKNKIASGLEKNEQIAAISDPAEKAAVVANEKQKNWRYYQRFHFHASGIGAITLGVLLLLLHVQAPEKLRVLTAWAVASGGLLYPFLWLFAGMYGPEMGRDAAKETFSFFGAMGMVFLAGLIAAFITVLKYPLRSHA